MASIPTFQAPHIGTVARIGLIGDVHAEHERLAAVLAFYESQAEPLDAILCTGDIADGAGDIDACCRLLADHGVHTVRGNHDRWLLTDKSRHIAQAHQREDTAASTLAFLDALPTTVRFDTPLGQGMLCHGVGERDMAKIWPGNSRMPPERSDELDALIDAGDLAVLLNGHMHFRTLVHFENLVLLNAGTLKPRHRPGFAIVDFERANATGYEFRGDYVEAVKTLGLRPDPHHRVFANTAEFDGEWQPTTLYAG